jgi:WhiB family transcriptional regulator, redox-sensing transcriptional regulator
MPRIGTAFVGIRPLQDSLDWQVRGACRGRDPNLFDAVEPGSEYAEYERVQEAQAICRACPVQVECLTWALNNPHVSGVCGAQHIVGGQIRTLHVRRRRAAKKDAA